VTAGSTPELSLEDVGREFPAWACYAPGIRGIVFARLRDSFPLVIVEGEDPADLRDSIKQHEASAAEGAKDAPA
jgi:hypothetical protein